jgi:microcystin degradation protein MlrC
MLAEGVDDATGDLLEAARAQVGDRTPVVASLDLHANVTRRMVRCASALVGYHTAPHVDQADTGARAVRLLLGILERGSQPTSALAQLPMVLPGEMARTTDGPYREVMDLAIALESRPGILSASAFSVQPWLDVPEMGCSVVVVADGDHGLARREARELAAAFWQRRKAFTPDLVPADRALDRALASQARPFVLSDAADAPSSGAPGDSTAVLARLLDREIGEPVLLNIVDPAAVAAAFRAGVGATIELTAGGTLSGGFCDPVTFSAYVKSLSDGRFRNKGPGFHGVEFQMGRTAVLVQSGIHLVAMERPVIQWDPELYRSQGLDPAEARIVIVKSPAAFRAAYEPFAAQVLILDVPGVCSANLQTFPWQHITRPMFPFDDLGDALPEPTGAV